MNKDYKHVNYFQYPNYLYPQNMPGVVMTEPEQPVRFSEPLEGFIRGNMIPSLYEPYKNYEPKVPVARNERDRLMLNIQMYDFALIDLQLYLDSYPDSPEVIELYNKYKDQVKVLKRQYEERYGPLCMEGEGLDKAPWAWQSGWPWEGGKM